MDAGGGEGRCFPSCLFFISVFKSNEGLRGRQEEMPEATERESVWLIL